MKIRNTLMAMIIGGFLIWPALAAAVSLGEAVAQVRAQYDVKKVLVAETRTVNGQRVHVIRILTNDGHVRQIVVNAGG